MSKRKYPIASWRFLEQRILLFPGAITSPPAAGPEAQSLSVHQLDLRS